jgi:hypothetical protein
MDKALRNAVGKELIIGRKKRILIPILDKRFVKYAG